MSESKFRISTGISYGYHWLSAELSLDDLLTKCPYVVQGRFIAVTSLDSGSFAPTDQKKSEGWTTHAGVAYSPLIRNAAELPTAGYDEWFVFSTPTRIGELLPGETNVFETGVKRGTVCAFVNFGIGFDHPSFDGLAELFWKQMAIIQPEIYISDNLTLNVATADATLFSAISAGLQEGDIR